LPNYLPEEVEVPMAKLDGKVAIVTGGSRGIGAATARRLAAEGAKVVVNYTQTARAADQVVDEIRKDGGHATALRADVSRRDEVASLVAATVEHYGGVDILVNNAAVLAPAPLAEITDDQVDRQFDVNVKGALYATQAAVPAFRNGGRVVNVSSIVAEAPLPGSAVYAASKAALESITRTFAAELAPRGVTVNAIAPGTTATDMYDSIASAELEERALARTPLGRLGRPEDIADVIAFLASDDARWITGQVINVSGGLRL
jgi:3-oxoacyl-[acyl-carrier protein] reductase